MFDSPRHTVFPRFSIDQTLQSRINSGPVGSVACGRRAGLRLTQRLTGVSCKCGRWRCRALLPVGRSIRSTGRSFRRGRFLAGSNSAHTPAVALWTSLACAFSRCARWPILQSAAEGSELAREMARLRIFVDWREAPEAATLRKSRASEFDRRGQPHAALPRAQPFRRGAFFGLRRPAARTARRSLT